ncbi:MAG: response regulator [Proteobacteria bacterium]|nr:response regulator [Pseudomonadota bacterium]
MDMHIASAPPRIALVEDDPNLTLLLAYNIEATGLLFACSSDGADALASIFAAPPDVVVLDWMLPRLSGIEVLRRIRLDTVTRDCPVILTGRTSPEDRRRALDVGATEFIAKPFAISDLT